MSVQVVRPASAGHETLWVLLLCLLILLVAAGVVLSHVDEHTEQELASHQLDARRDLNAAEQGVHTDLVVAYEEIRWHLSEEGELPSPAELAAEGFPPFSADASASNRGRHQWQRLQRGKEVVYLGRSQAPETAGTFLLWPQADEVDADIWLSRDNQADVPAVLTTEQLIAAGWRQILVHFDAGVTRHPHH